MHQSEAVAHFVRKCALIIQIKLPFGWNTRIQRDPQTSPDNDASMQNFGESDIFVWQYLAAEYVRGTLLSHHEASLDRELACTAENTVQNGIER